MDIQVWSDVTCPWCYIGRIRLEKALTAFDGVVTVTYRAYQLNPAPPPQPQLVKQVMAEQIGGLARAQEMLARVTAIAASEGLTFDFDRAIVADTFAAHRLIAWAAIHERQIDMLDALQQAHFTHGFDIGSPVVLATVAASAGLDPAAALTHLESTAGTSAVRTDIEEAQALGINGVPTLVVDGKYIIQGAQEPSTLLAAFDEITRRETANAGL